MFSDAASTWNHRFAADGYLFGTEPNAWLQIHAGCLKPGQKVLCVADGEGRNSVWLAQQGLQVDAFDIASVGVTKAQRLAEQNGVQVNCQVADCDQYAWPEARYDGVVAIFVQFADPVQRQRLFAHMAAALKPGGHLLLLGYTPKQLVYRTGGPNIESHLYTEVLLRQSFAELQIKQLHSFEAEVAEGSGHKGMSALVGLVAQRSGPQNPA